MPKEELKPRKICATLPALGTYTVPFYKESAKILALLGDKELNRLSKIAHLGTAATVFTGINHSRLEYMLLQCAIINLLPKFNLGTEQFAISGKVKLAGGNSQFSSGEELLKYWSIFSNIGHTQYTYGVERALFSYLRRNKDSKKFFLSMIRQAELQEWSKKVIENYQDSNFHWILSILRISQYIPLGNRDKGLFNQCLINLLLPLENLNFKSHNDRYKMYRLRKIFEQIRLLSLVTLDSYYSHHPVRYQISTAIMDLENLFLDQETGFENLLIQTASWLADELYMHPNSAATLRYYEIQSSQKFNKYYEKFFKSVDEFKGFMSNFMNDGFGQPSNNHLKIFLRVSLSEKQAAIFRNKDTYDIRNILEKQITKPRKTRISVLKNPFSKNLHIDLFYDYYESSPYDIGQLCCGFYKWFIRTIKVHAASSLEESFSKEIIKKFPPRFKEEFRLMILRQNMEEFQNIFSHMLSSVIKYLIPEDSIGSIVEFIPSSKLKQPFLTRLKDDDLQFDNIKINLENSIVDNPFKLHADRIQELKAIKHVVQYSRFPLLIVCADKFILRNSGGRHVAEWDGIILEISQQKACLNIIEAKNKGTDHQNEKEAFDQLAKCRNFIKLKHKSMETNRVRIPALGAKLKISLC
ncbi:hypothetical protein [Coleofasciculus sp. FACHB-129]|uniref:hypothetical protein n=1 Tax=Cyanophyceae TaxID=3028117 RepID=UPI0016894E79|nr:hypothetical protein [Coleofasciculus sp. FACHB-129]MBD1895625.1 hypothetical protein [Coleofasciculus sp. FACHB-129]